MTFEAFWKEYTKDLDLWNMSIEEYNYRRTIARKMWKEIFNKIGGNWYEKNTHTQGHSEPDYH